MKICVFWDKYVTTFYSLNYGQQSMLDKIMYKMGVVIYLLPIT